MGKTGIALTARPVALPAVFAGAGDEALAVGAGEGLTFVASVTGAAAVFEAAGLAAGLESAAAIFELGEGAEEDAAAGVTVGLAGGLCVTASAALLSRSAEAVPGRPTGPSTRLGLRFVPPSSQYAGTNAPRAAASTSSRWLPGPRMGDASRLSGMP